MDIRKKKIIPYCIVLLLATFAVLTGSIRAFAEDFDRTRNVSLTVEAQYDLKAVEGIEMKLYRIAEFPESDTLVPTPQFSSYPVSWNRKGTSEWKSLGETLATYIARDHIAPLDKGKTNHFGKLTFPNEISSLQLGVYLVIGESKVVGDKVYSPEPFLITLPARTQDMKWNYCIKSKVKYSTTPSTEQFHDKRVWKIWRDSGYEDKRPSFVEVSLMRDGVVVETVILNKDNNWQHIWKDLSSKYKWQVVEKNRWSDYAVSSEVNGHTFILINTYDPYKPDKPDKPEPNKPDKPVPNGRGGGGGGTLPQSGVLWWKIQLTAIVGTLFIVLGWMRDRRINKGSY